MSNENVVLKVKSSIRKRDGRVEEFNRYKITEAIEKAFFAVDGKLDEYSINKARNIAKYIEGQSHDQTLSIEEIQDLVENGLMATKRKDVAKAYINYRHDRTIEREKNSNLMKLIGEKLNATNVQNQNANVDEKSIGGRMGEARNVLTKKYALDYIISPKTKFNHVNNRIYIHDLDNYASGAHNCLSVPFDYVLANGFNTRQTDVRPANSVNTAFQLVAVIFQLQSLQQFGGVSATHIDWTMVRYVRKSFMKHYIVAYLKKLPDFLSLDLIDLVFEEYKEKAGKNLYIIRNKFDDWVDSHKDEFFKKTGLSFKDFYFGNDKLDKELYQSAMYDTLIEVKQAVEGMYHNLNTLQSRSGNQLDNTVAGISEMV